MIYFLFAKLFKLVAYFFLHIEKNSWLLWAKQPKSLVGCGCLLKLPLYHQKLQGQIMLHFKPFLEGNWKCVHPQDLPWNQSQYPCTFQIYWNYHFCLSVHCQNSPILHWTSEEHLWPCKYWNNANHFRFTLDILWNLISIYLVTSSALLLILGD